MNNFELYCAQCELVRKKCSYCDGGETGEQVEQRNCGCLITDYVQSQVGWTFQQPDLVKDVPP